VSAEIFAGVGKVDILLFVFRLLTVQCKCKWTFTTLSTPQRKWPMLRQQSQKMCFVGSNVSFHTVWN